MEATLIKTSPQLPATTFKILTEDEKYFLSAEKEYTIKQYAELKIEDKNSGYQGEQLARYHIGNSLHQVFEMVGLKKENYPSKELAKKITKYIQDTFPYITPSELVTAVIFGLQGKYNNLNSDGKSIFEHYGVMDIPYINTFMQLYVKFRYEKKVSITAKIEKSILPTKADVISYLQKDDAAVKEMIKDAFNSFKESPNEKVTWLRDVWFYWLCDIGLIQYDREKLNQHFQAIKKVRWDLTSTECFHMVCVENIYEMFERIKDQENPFEIFNNVTYVNPETYSKLGTVGHSQA